MTFAEVPFCLPGAVIASGMPFSQFDTGCALFELYQDLNISAVVVLCSLDEIQAVTGRDLPSEYAQAGMRVITLPIPDFGVPAAGDLQASVAAALAHVREGGNLAIHCHGGVGRTGLFAACLAREVLGLDGETAIDWVRRFIPGAVEMEAQRQAVIEYRSAAC